ncbi:hypothetical protein SAMN05421810_108103 [Amycolatopsis arida]|uniref:Uncharacterized protein n=1 Tax=Amycolatopsis arida TaxID=587909 RepID=A0A1I5Z095_9PSEU|nr:hypothetical protein [Amycolatopsis arida]TDX90016.1 hypothetical protein CLV69_108103 [Amycolatopsis arida]SFQ49849.1 hypothetical protein SAMN05421810_108103 [Amycolatopsis arida]
MVLTRLPLLTGMAQELRRAPFPLTEHWRRVGNWFDRRVRCPGLRDELRHYLRTLPPQAAAAVADRSRETTTHYAWCLLDRPEDEFSFWLHEYKPQRDWRHGYADSVHNHRYHFCTTILSGGYEHERYDVALDPDGHLVDSAVLRHSIVCRRGASGALLAHEFHRIPRAADNTMTFLVKSRPVRGWSLSYDPITASSQRHVPVEARLGELVERM